MLEPSRVATERRPAADARLERFRVRNGAYERLLVRSDGRTVTSRFAPFATALTTPATADDAERAWLQNDETPAGTGTRSPLRTIDLFAGCGGLSIGLAEAARALNRPFAPLLAVDLDGTATRTYAANFPTAASLTTDVEHLLPGAVGSRLTPAERLLAKQHRDVDVLVGGPPCQGHSDFNNRTRHVDDKNELYRTMVRAAEVFTPEHVLIENVPGAVNDRRAVVQRTADALVDLGYHVATGVVNLGDIGVPQTRRRLILVASLTRPVTPAEVVARHRRDTRSVAWAFEDLDGRASDDLVDAVAQSAPATRRRIDYLFDHDHFDLPDHQRPACHAGGGHSYKSIYGRLSWDRPAQTVTTGFYSMCMGRNVHPGRRRTITAHEAARLQYIPDWFRFDGVRGRTALARMIGNAVPSRLSYGVAVEWLR